MNDDDLADDMLPGAKAISRYIKEDERRTYRLLEAGLIPGFKVGGLWRARKSTLKAHYAKLEQGGGAR
jgi:hypothetical protein